MCYTAGMAALTHLPLRVAPSLPPRLDGLLAYVGTTEQGRTLPVVTRSDVGRLALEIGTAMLEARAAGSSAEAEAAAGDAALSEWSHPVSA